MYEERLSVIVSRRGGPPRALAELHDDRAQTDQLVTPTSVYVFAPQVRWRRASCRTSIHLLRVTSPRAPKKRFVKELLKRHGTPSK